MLTKTDKGLAIKAFFNNVKTDAFFFKTLGHNGPSSSLPPLPHSLGVCTQWCDGVLLPDPQPYGVNQYGASLKFSISDLSATKHSAAIAQLTQTAHLPLQTPYTITGLGRISNYIEYTFLGVPYRGKNGHWYSWSGLIPNSQIVAIPYPPEEPTQYVSMSTWKTVCS